MTPMMRFYDLDGQVYCRPCRDNLLANADRALAAYAGHDVSDIEVVRPRSFEALGDRPWAGNEVGGDRYVQCDGCCGQWGPDA